MTVRQPLFQNADTTDQNAVNLRLFLKDFLNSRPGIIQGNALQVSQRASGANLTVDVAAGSVVVPGTEATDQGYYYVVNDKLLNLTLDTVPHATLPRIDSVVVYVRDNSYAFGDPGGFEYTDATIRLVSGTAAASPVAPDLDALGLENYYVLANVTIGANAKTITSANITDKRISPATTTQGEATGVGCPIVCTSTSRPSSPRTGQVIWESDTKLIRINEGSSTAPSWTVYASAGQSRWVSYTPKFPLSGSNKIYGRYIKVGSIIVGISGFTLGTNGNVTGSVYCSLPRAAYDPNNNGAYMGGGRAHNATGFLQGVFWSCSAIIDEGGSNLQRFGTGGTAAWNATIPFDWGSGSNAYQRGDALAMMFCYEVTP